MTAALSRLAEPAADAAIAAAAKTLQLAHHPRPGFPAGCRGGQATPDA